MKKFDKNLFNEKCEIIYKNHIDFFKAQNSPFDKPSSYIISSHYGSDISGNNLPENIRKEIELAYSESFFN